MDLQTEFAPLFRDEPPPAPVDTTLRTGRRALLRRRVGTGLATLAVVAALGASYAATSVGSAVDETPTASRTSTGATAAPDQLVVADGRGEWTLAPGVTLVREIDNPFDLPAPYTSAALELRSGDTTYDVVLTPSSAVTKEREDDGSLEALVDSFRQGGPSFTQSGPSPDLVGLGTDAMPSVLDDVKVRRVVDNPLAVAPPRRSIGYELRKDGQTWWYLWERGPSGLDGVQTVRLAGDGAYPSFEAWLADQRSTTQW